MSRHSHWAKIKRAKGVDDVKKGMAFTKLSRAITVAAREKGIDPVMNFKLRLAIDAARAVNMPRDTIERAIARATGGEDSVSLEEVSYEIIGPGGVAIIVDAVTDNRNRTSGTIKAILSKHGGSLAGLGAIKWQFDRRGVLRIPGNAIPSDLEMFELELIDKGAVDVREEEGGLTVMTDPEIFPIMIHYLQEKKITVEYSAITWVPKNIVIVDESVREQLELVETLLQDDDDVTEVATNEG